MDFDSLDSNCKDLFDLYLLSYEQFKTQCTNQTEALPLAVCIGELVLSEMELVLKNVMKTEACVEFIAPVIKCLGVQLNITEMAHRTFTENENNITKTEL